MLDRRQWLKFSLAAGAGAASGLGFGGCDSPPRTLLEGAVATFEVTDTGALVAVYSAVPTTAHVEVDTSSGLMISPAFDLSESTGNTGFVELVDLEPDTEYVYRVVTELGGESAPYRLRTAPPPDEPHEFTFLFSADLDVDPLWDSPILTAMALTPASFYISLGDWPYADNAPGAITLAEYRERHRQARAAAKVTPLLQQFPVFAIWDDHEARNNWNAHFAEVEADRIAAAVQAWDEWFPLRDTSSPKIRYRSWRWGSLVEVFMLDLRMYRSDNHDPDGPDKTMLGAGQKGWLKGSLAASTAPYKIVITSVPLDFGELIGVDCWRNFRTERDEVLGFILDNQISGVVFLAADQHWFAAHHFANGLKEFQVGPLARGLPELDPIQPEVVARESGYNYGEIAVRADALEVVARDAYGAELYREAIRPGRGVLRVDSDPPGRGFVATGAHRFAGTTPAEFAHATPGTYAVSWDDGETGPGGELRDGEILVLS